MYCIAKTMQSKGNVVRRRLQKHRGLSSHRKKELYHANEETHMLL